PRPRDRTRARGRDGRHAHADEQLDVHAGAAGVKHALLALALVACGRDPAHVSVGVAASLRYAMPELVTAYEQQASIAIDVTYGASDLLAEQATRGVPLDALVLAESAALD